MMEQFTKQVGVPFRETHHVAGAAVALAESVCMYFIFPIPWSKHWDPLYCFGLRAEWIV